MSESKEDVQESSSPSCCDISYCSHSFCYSSRNTGNIRSMPLSSKNFKVLVLSWCFFIWLNSLTKVDNQQDQQQGRKLSLNLGNGACKWQPPTYDIPEEIDFYKTIIAGFPSGDKRLTFVQMEALAGWAAKDEWDFEYLGMTNHPFIKANYPHHEGIWGWEDVADQVIMVVRNMRRSMVEYHDILWDIGYAKTWEEATLNLLKLYAERPPLEDFLDWRDLRVMDEVHWYGWFIDYWMEEGLLRDIFSHKITTQQHWDMLMQPTAFTKEEMAYDLIVGPDTIVNATYDVHCVKDVSDGCHPVQIISAERLVKAETGPAEGRKIAMALQNHSGISEYLIEEEVWMCIWQELIVHKKGLKTFIDREGVTERDYNFSGEMLEEMLHELDRLIQKYSSETWFWRQTSKDLVVLFKEHHALIQKELDEVNSGVRVLKDDDILGPKERKKRRRQKLEEEISQKLAGVSNEEKERHLFHIMKSEEEKKKDYSEFYRAIEKKLLENRREKIKSEVFAEDRQRRKLKRMEK